MKYGVLEGAATKPHSRLLAFEFGLAITNFVLKISITQIANATEAPTDRNKNTMDNKPQPQNAWECKPKPNLDRRADCQTLFSVNTKTRYKNTRAVKQTKIQI